MNKQITEEDIQAQKDYAIAFADELSDRLMARSETEVFIDYVTILEAMDTVELQFSNVESSHTNHASAALMHAIIFDYEIPVRERDKWNIYTCWIQERFNITREEAIEIHNFIDDNKLINWDNMNAMDWTFDMTILWDNAMEQAELELIKKRLNNN
jgi:hypothetical protein